MSWIHTFTGKAFDLLDPQPEQVCIEDIAHALSLICRYTGHAAWHYSVAQHCVVMSEIVEPEHALWALLHDAPEAYVNDLARPIKHLPAIREAYGEVERRVEWVVTQALGVLGAATPSAVAAVREADVRLLATEARQLLPWPPPRGWNHDAEPYDLEVEPWEPAFAESMYLERYSELRPDHA